MGIKLWRVFLSAEVRSCPVSLQQPYLSPPKVFLTTVVITVDVVTQLYLNILVMTLEVITVNLINIVVIIRDVLIMIHVITVGVIITCYHHSYH